MDDDKEIYNLRKDMPAHLLQEEAKELLLSATMMVSVLNNQAKQTLTLPQHYLIKVMNELINQLLELFSRLYDDTAVDIAIHQRKENVFVLKSKLTQTQITKYMFNKLYQVGGITMIVVTDLLEGFTTTNANVLLSLAETIKRLTQVLESLALLPSDGTPAALHAFNSPETVTQ